MEVITRVSSTPYDKWPVVILCYRCDAILEVDEKDIVYDSNLSDFYVKCPVCNGKIYISKFDLPESLVNKLIKDYNDKL